MLSTREQSRDVFIHHLKTLSNDHVASRCEVEIRENSICSVLRAGRIHDIWSLMEDSNIGF